MKLITLTNDFHNTEVTLRVDLENPIADWPDYTTFLLSANQVKKARRKLCPSPDCRCAQHEAGIRGQQYVDGKLIHIQSLRTN